LIALALVITVGMAGCPRYNVWRLELRGKAALKEAEWNRQIAIEEANARKESAVLLAQAEVERAIGVAEANEIIGESLRENEAYLRYLWINGLHDGSSEVIYIPTEANLPILEAVRKMREPNVTVVLPEEDR
jgi:regulator of protease activity HflC (stomatin/prohibitin superfamily)